MKHSKLFQEFTEYQDKTSWYAHHDECNAPELSYLAMGLAGEAGECIDEIKKVIRVSGQEDINLFNHLIKHPSTRAVILKEMGDTLWYLNKMCTFMGLTIEELAVKNTIKLFHRTRKDGKCTDVVWPFSPGTVEDEFITGEMYKMGARG